MDFGKWTGIHEDPDQVKRLERAKSSACTPLSVSKEDTTGVFSGSHGTYKTTLETCTCGDFIRRKLPCKHIYRLAIELNVIAESASSDPSAIKRPTPDGLSLEVAVEILETYSEEAQLVLMQTLRNKLYRKRETYKPKKTDGVTEIIASGLAVDASNGAVSVADCILNCGRKLCTYLLRKYEDDDEGQLYSYPHGANSVTTIRINGITSSGYEFPDDEVTELLNKYDANRCRNLIMSTPTRRRLKTACTCLNVKASRDIFRLPWTPSG